MFDSTLKTIVLPVIDYVSRVNERYRLQTTDEFAIAKIRS